MSRHWNPNEARDLAGYGSRDEVRARRRRSLRRVRLTVEAGLLMGLGAFGLVQAVGTQVPALVRGAAAAPARLDQLLAAGPFGMERLGPDQDRYGRKLRIVTRDGRSIGGQLAAEGLARTWTGRREPWC